MDDKPDITPAQLVAEYLQLRRTKKAAKEQYTEFCRQNYEEPMAKLEVQLLAILNKMGADRLGGPTGTVYKIRHTSVTTADGGAFRRHVIGSEEWDLADWKPNKTMINEMVDNGEELPPGINRTVIYKIGVRKGDEE